MEPACYPGGAGRQKEKKKTDEKLLQTVGLISITLSLSDGAERLVYLHVTQEKIPTRVYCPTRSATIFDLFPAPPPPTAAIEAPASLREGLLVFVPLLLFIFSAPPFPPFNLSGGGGKERRRRRKKKRVPATTKRLDLASCFISALL